MTDTSRLNAALAGRYLIERHVGQGGMATVYLARDIKHQRKVALKVLRPELAAVIGGERFLKEIEVTANLQHPNILPLYDSGQADGFLYYVMPYVEGESLRARLTREKQIGVEETLSIAKAVASALHYAHRQGVIHRDVKPENILLHDGQALVADFGIALAVSQAGGARMTETGLSLGTPQYMSPEQATGDRTIDARSDVYSLGAVTYEMLTGDPPHTGNTMQAIIARILSATPTPITQVRGLVPAHVEYAVQRALAKTPADRFATAADFAAALSNPAFVPMTATIAPAAALVRAQTSKRLTFALAAALIVVTAALAWSLVANRHETTSRVRRVAVALPEANPLAMMAGFPAIAISPDGEQLAYAGLAEGKQMILLRRMNSLSPQPIPGTEAGSQPFFAPDGTTLGFFAAGLLKTVAIDGGPAITIAPAPIPRGGTWTDDGYIVFGVSIGGLMRVRAEGGTPERLTEVDSTDRANGVTGHRWPTALPGGRSIVFSVFTGLLTESQIAVVSIGSKTERVLFPGTMPSYHPSGTLFYVNSEGALVGRAFDPAKQEASGPAVTLQGGIAVDATSTTAFYAVSNSGTLVYLQGSLVRGIVRVDRNGNEQVLLDSLVAPASLRFSPDGNRIAMEMQSGGQLRIWTYDLVRGINTPLTFAETQARYPEWSRAGDRLLFSRLEKGAAGRDVYEIAADGSGTPRLVYSAPGDQFEAAWLPDGKRLVIRETAHVTGDRNIWIVSPDEREKRMELANTSADERAISLSSDGRWLAHVSTESGQSEVYVRAMDGSGGKWQISRNGGLEPVWSNDGRELYYRDAQNLIAVSVQTTPSFEVRGSRVLFKDAVYARSTDRASYDVHTSGQWFAMARNLTSKADIVIVFDWLSEVRSKITR